MESLKVPLIELAAGHGADIASQNRPGVPMEVAPVQLLSDVAIERQGSRGVTVFRRKGLGELTPVYGTAQPPRGFSGIVKALAYQKSESNAAHWGLLLLSDRVDVIEGRVGDFLRRPSVRIAALVCVGGLLAFAIVRQRRKAIS